MVSLGYFVRFTLALALNVLCNNLLRALATTVSCGILIKKTFFSAKIQYKIYGIY